MAILLEAGPFSAKNDEGRSLFQGAKISLEEGRATVLDGPSGSGKSTLLRHVAGLSDHGSPASRQLDSEEFSGSNLPKWRARVTLMSQDAPMIPGSVWRNLTMPFGFRCSRGRAVDETTARRLLRDVGLSELADDRDVSTLSGGERHRLALARGLLWDPPVLLADEPLSGLDSTTAVACFDLLLAFAHRPGHALLFVLHDSTLSYRADTSYTVAEGRLEAT